MQRGEYWVFSLFPLSHSSYFINHRSVTRSKKNDLTVYFFHWYLFIGHLYVCFRLFLLWFHVNCFSWGANRTWRRGAASHWSFTLCRESKILYPAITLMFSLYNNGSTGRNRNLQHSKVHCFCLYCVCQTCFAYCLLSEGPNKQTAHGSMQPRHDSALLKLTVVLYVTCMFFNLNATKQTRCVCFFSWRYSIWW